MFAWILQMVLTVAAGSIKNPGHVSATEWLIIQDVSDALTTLLGKKPNT